MKKGNLKILVVFILLLLVVFSFVISKLLKEREESIIKQKTDYIDYLDETDQLNRTKVENKSNSYDLGFSADRAIYIYKNETFCLESKNLNICYPHNALNEYIRFKYDIETPYTVLIEQYLGLKTIYFINPNQMQDPIIMSVGIEKSTPPS